MKILIVEDDLIQSTNLKIQLSSLGLNDVTIVNHPKSLQTLINNDYYDLAFCDLQMPQIDGISLLSQHLNKDRVGGVVIMSVVEDIILQLTKGMCNLLDYRFVEVLPKPFELPDLAIVIEHYNYMKNKEDVVNKDNVILTHSDIYDAFSENRIFVLYQPQYDFGSGDMVGVEALVRMISRDNEMLPPASFLPLVSSANLMEKLYLRVLEKSTKALSKICLPLRLSVNVNQQLLQKDICDLTIVVCQKTGFPLEKLTLELTEEDAYNATPTALANLARLRLHGVQLSIDDFGTGYASLEQLVDLPFTELKIDRLFISKVLTDYKHQQLTKTILNLAQSLNLYSVAEGVEDKETWEYLKELGVDVCQGFYTGKPMHINEINDLCRFISGDLPESDEIFKSTTILLLDDDSTRRNALIKLLDKALPKHSIVGAQTKEECSALLRDLPISYLLLDGSYVASLITDEWFSEVEKTQTFSTIVLVESDITVTPSTSLICINKATLIADTTQLIVDQIERSEQASSQSIEVERLSKREIEVAKLLIAGFTNKHIAYELGINQKTVSTYKTRVLEKMGVRTTIELSRLIQLHDDR